jgi:hypothetical protein
MEFKIVSQQPSCHFLRTTPSKAVVAHLWRELSEFEKRRPRLDNEELDPSNDNFVVTRACSDILV